MKKVLFPTLFLFGSFLSPAQSPGFVWAKQLSVATSTDDATPVSIKLDAAGNVYTMGHFDGTLDCDPGPGTFTLNSPGGMNAVYISKLDPQGNFIWAKQLSGSAQLGGSLYTSAGGMDLGSGGEIYLTGYFEGLVDFDPGASTSLLYGGPVGTNIFVCKLDAQGNYVWAKQMGDQTVSGDAGNSIAVDAQNNVYVTGFFAGTGDFDPGAGTYTMTASNLILEAFIAKLNAAGNFVWARQLQTSSGSMGNDVSVDGAGNVYSTGSFNNSGDFDPGAGTYSLGTTGSQEAYLWKLDASGNFIWARYIGGPLIEGGSVLVSDAVGNVILSGFYTGQVDLDPGAATLTVTSAGGYDLFISKFDAQGNLVWARSAGGTGEDVASGLSLNAGGDVYCTGYFENTVDFDMGAGTYTLSTPNRNIFISKMDAAGNFAWVKHLAGTGSGGGSSIVADASGNVYSTGIFQAAADFDPNAGTYTLSTGGGFDAYVHKMNCANSYTLNVMSNAGIICAGNSATLTVNGAASYSWNAAPGSSLQVISPTVTASFSVTGSDANGCLYSGSITQSVSACTGLENVAGNSATLHIYPNPAKDWLLVDAGTTEGKDLFIYNTLGQLVIQKHSISGQHRLNIEQLPAGLYVISLVQDHQLLSTQKLLKE
jgi:hypothetical protein